MMNYDELTKNLLARRDRYVADQKKKRKTVMRVTASLSCVCFVALLGIGVWQSNLFGTQTPDESKIIWADSSDTTDSDIIEQNGNWFSHGLYNALEKASDTDVFAILARPKENGTFQYKGISLEKYYLAMCEERNLPEKLRQMFKEGDALKYGEVLYTTGTPSGEKWAKELYEERIQFYGEDLLNRYIVDGNFLKHNLEADITKAETANEATLAYEEAKRAYLATLAQRIKGEFSTEVDVTNNALLIYMSRDMFDSFTKGDISEWMFGLASKNDDADVYVETA